MISYLRTQSFRSVQDSISLLRYEKPGRVRYLLQASKSDSTKKRFSYYVQDGLIKRDLYQCDLIAVVDLDEEQENVSYWLKCFDQSRNKVGHLDFAAWYKEYHDSGRIDCDTTIHLMRTDRNEHLVFRLDDTGAINLVRKTPIKN